MKKLIIILLLSFVGSGIYAQIKLTQPWVVESNNGDSFGYYLDPIPGAVSYDWQVAGNTGAIIWPAWDEAVDLTFTYSGVCYLTCTVTMSDNSVQVFLIEITVNEAED
ncbi:MAG: hypothetical protein J7578_00340 [Chitinophagaceae bacterium]|nr:hypothetical protein [Chitinophagaceae bacterium]